MSEEIIEQLYSVPALARLVLSNIRGSVVINPGEDGVIQVTAVKRTNTGNAEHTQVRLSQAEDGSVRVETHFDLGSWGFLDLNGPCKVDYNVRVPPACSLKVSGVSNSAAISQVQGEADISTVSGDLRLSGLSGNLSISSVSARVQGEALHGSLRLDTVSGDVRLLESDFSQMVASTVSGRVDIHSPLVGSDLRFKSVSGDYRLFVTGELSCRIVSDSLSGRIHMHPGLRSGAGQDIRQRGKSVLEAGSGSAQIRHNSVSGSLYIEAARLAPAETQAQAEQPLEEPGDVLERLSRGEINVDEAVELLRK
jgi:hypothetical protein